MSSFLRDTLERAGLPLAAAQNLGWLVTERLVRLVFNVGVGILVARYLGPAQFGTLNYALALVAIGLAISEAGVEAFVKRELIRDPERAAAVLGAAWRLRLIAGGLCYATSLMWAAWSETDRVASALVAILGLMLFQPALAVSDLWLHARLQARLAIRARLAALIIGALGRVVLVILGTPLVAFAIIAVVEAAIAVVLLNWTARTAGRPDHAVFVTSDEMSRLWNDSWPLLLSAITVILYMRIDVVMLRQMSSETDAGTYAAAVRLSELASFFPAAIVTSLLPGLLSAKADGADAYGRSLQRLFDLNALVAYAVAIPMVLLAPWIVGLAYGESFAPAGPVLAVHGATLMWAALGVVRGQFCVNEGLTHFHLLATSAGAVLNMLLNFIFIPRYGAVGAAWGTLIAQGFAAWVSSFCFQPVRRCAVMQTRALFIPLRLVAAVRSIALKTRIR